ncbi:MAG: hypothetical protein IH840_17450 [Candidatus Heimdallarchaeota archaeon]|nr:hypothetical protein [Candidatus Heimdallarchaeota archaeon]
MVKRDLQNELRNTIYAEFVQSAHAPSIEELSIVFNLSRHQILLELVEMEKNHYLVMQPNANRILFANPFSNIKTAYKVIVERTKMQYYANCSWDAIAFHFMFKERISVDSFCYHCLQPLRFHLKNEEIVEKSHSNLFVYFTKPAVKWWDDIIDTCSNTMIFLCSDDHKTKWEKSTGIRGRKLLENQIIGLSQFFYATKLDLDYVRPTVESTQEKFEELGLHDSFWKM